MMSSGKEATDLILDPSSAKAASDKLANEYGLPSSDNGEDEIRGYDPRYKPLYKAIQIGDWEATKNFLNAHPEALTAKITALGTTALHAAVVFEHLHIVEGLVELMSEEDMELKDGNDRHPLVQACFVEMTQIARCIVNKNKKTPTIPDPVHGILPVCLAVVHRDKELTIYLYSMTPFQELLPEKGYQGASLLIQSFLADYLDMALDLLRQCPSLAITPDHNGTIFVGILAYRRSIFPSGCELSLSKQLIYNRINIKPTVLANEIRIDVQNSNTKASDGKISLIWGLMDLAVLAFLDLLGIRQIYETKLVHKQSEELLRITCDQISNLNYKQLVETRLYNSILAAAQEGVPEFIVEVVKTNPELVWSQNEVTDNLFIGAVQYRQAQVFSLIYGFIWKNQAAFRYNRHSGDTMLHMAGKLAPPGQLNRISGAALKMQRELQWFKEVESITPPPRREQINKSGLKARELFTEEHKDLLKEGEKWMKETATSCTVVGALIITIMFAAAFTVPGGNNQDTGYPIFLNQKLFMLFIISDAISLFSSSTSVLMFLGILTSRYAEDDFLKSLPTKLIIGLSLLFISIAAMMAAFCTALSITLEGKSWIITPVILLASVPIGLFVKLQFPLLVEIFISTYRPGIFERNVKRWF